MATSEKQIKKNKRMSNKEIYRILAFEFKQQDSLGIKISLISEMVSSLFYPHDEQGEAKQNFKTLIENSFKSYCFKDEISEDAFCNAMDSVEKYINEETSERFLQKIFRRHDKDKDGYLNKEGKLKINLNICLEFSFLMRNYKDENLTEQDIEDIFARMSKGDVKGVDFNNFKKYSL